MDNHSFEYTYSAQRQQEVEEIRKAYLPKEEDKMEILRNLHRVPEKKARAVSISLGIIGALILGTGMSLCMTEIGAVLGDFSMVIGIIVGICGIALVIVAYPCHNRILHQERMKIAPEILRLTDELLK